MYLKVGKWIDIKSSHHKEKNCNYEVMDVNLWSFLSMNIH